MGHTSKLIDPEDRLWCNNLPPREVWGYISGELGLHQFCLRKPSWDFLLYKGPIGYLCAHYLPVWLLDPSSLSCYTSGPEKGQFLNVKGQCKLALLSQKVMGMKNLKVSDLSPHNYHQLTDVQRSYNIDLRNKTHKKLLYQHKIFLNWEIRMGICLPVWQNQSTNPLLSAGS